jgi:hypothetical membrane protein
MLKRISESGQFIQTGVILHSKSYKLNHILHVMMYDTKKTAGALFFFGSIQILLLMIVAEAVCPDYSVSQNYISDLGVGNTAYIFNSSVFLLGVFILAGTYFVHKTFGFSLLSILLVLTGIGAMGVGMFPGDAGIIHSIAAMICFLFGGLSAVISYKVQKSPFSYFSVVLGAISLLALGLFVSGACLGLGYGGMERMIAHPTLLWGVGFGGYLMGSST